jgi:hypothetical protein
MLGFVDKRESQINWCLIQNRIYQRRSGYGERSISSIAGRPPGSAGEAA